MLLFRHNLFTSDIAAVGQVSTTSTQSQVSQSTGFLTTATFSVIGSSLDEIIQALFSRSSKTVGHSSTHKAHPMHKSGSTLRKAMIPSRHLKMDFGVTDVRMPRIRRDETGHFQFRQKSRHAKSEVMQSIDLRF
jgi:hypothetical protein